MIGGIKRVNSIQPSWTTFMKETPILMKDHPNTEKI
jgi:hypothetical protein